MPSWCQSASRHSTVARTIRHRIDHRGARRHHRPGPHCNARLQNRTGRDQGTRSDARRAAQDGTGADMRRFLDNAVMLDDSAGVH